MNPSYDVIFVGAGIINRSSAYQVVRKVLRVVILESGSIGDGPTGKSLAMGLNWVTPLA
ncbi:MAG: FAD-binding oxidoreductase [Chloroflexi bacterium]|nr:FAD-binding oxidoreductase [Chloroflexota bacterium]